MGPALLSPCRSGCAALHGSKVAKGKFLPVRAQRLSRVSQLVCSKRRPLDICARPSFTANPVGPAAKPAAQPQTTAAALPFPLASITAANPNQELFVVLARLLDFYIILLMVRVILSWFRGVDWYKEPWTYLRELTDPYLNIFRGIIPPFGRIDVSPIIGFLLLQFLQRFVAGLAGGAM